MFKLKISISKLDIEIEKQNNRKITTQHDRV